MKHIKNNRQTSQFNPRNATNYYRKKYTLKACGSEAEGIARGGVGVQQANLPGRGVRITTPDIVVTPATRHMCSSGDPRGYDSGPQRNELQHVGGGA